ncbi:4Fe-4S ferredoxin iron-sulfur binding domain protein [Desulfatibacillum aliphaticivorans]|uniref:4Fe-4S ferredoxin iron-sulfur binding domain protein n=1 Tax=Desulfatibacillum aliphaticivorans TaxID=218208 RepID=B8F9F6_DESAL|nr:4Fe-4S binding protein [Desulfatibacillum aliphaticivorans]ACL02902.1 4Fe-4S ferredoxin iron-sulfur binding domain protein [Desulfatibacillum aliphaticivorans]
MQTPEPLKFYAKKLGYPKSETLGTILSTLFDTEEKQKVAAALPGDAPQLSEKTGVPVEEVRSILKVLRHFGAICKNQKVQAEEEVYVLYPGLIELRDAVLLTPGIGMDMVELWDRMIRKEMQEIFPTWKKLNVPPMMRTIPVEAAVDTRSTVLDEDSARHIIENARQIVAIPCVCRATRHRLNKSPDCPAPEDAHICMLINKFGMEALERGIGAEITTKEALAKLKAAEDAGLVHMTRNNVKSDVALCNCCSCCCTGLFAVNQVKYEAFAPSRFRVKLDEESCLGCGTCVDRCQFHAIECEDVAVIDLASCFGCGNCVSTCPGEALTLEEFRPKDFIRNT